MKDSGTRRLNVEHWLNEASRGAFDVQVRRLLGVLGYTSDRTLSGQSGEVADFVTEFQSKYPNTASEKLLLDEVTDIKLLFQVTDQEIAIIEQAVLMDPGPLDSVNTKSFLFVAVELNKDSYPRGTYAELTREINKRFMMPTVVFLRARSGSVTVAFVHRRGHRNQQDRDVLGSVSLVREIDTRSPHRAHIDILCELSLHERIAWLDGHRAPHNFDGLLESWLHVLDIEELNKRFYTDLTRWFELARQEIRLPDAQQVIEPVIIRLVTRLIFVWFMKEKGLVASDLFNEEQVSTLLVDYDQQTGSSYYRAVLQNLFFATLNTSRSDRAFSKGERSTHRVFEAYRYEYEIADTDRLVSLFDQSPFVNGGLFDCLDSLEAGRDGTRIDYFTDSEHQRRGFAVPNKVFFGSVGLLRLFESYKFTVEENTPATQEVALDPELLGNVFENLLAAQVPGSDTNVRNVTGSFYTPRNVVDFIVEETLVSVLASKLTTTTEDRAWMEDRLRYLFDYRDAFNDANELFSRSESERLVGEIAELRLIDPAVGSGAFPMSALHKLTLALGRVDPANELWENVQREIAVSHSSKAYSVDDRQAREERLMDVSSVFETYRDGDYGRKLYLIQNNIFGVDILPVACQIARLRFFITLAIEQEREDTDNYGFRALPNLDMRLVAADALLPINGPVQHLVSNGTQSLLEQILNEQESYFHASTRQGKLAIRQRLGVLRADLGTELERVGFAAESARRLADWDPTDEEGHANWFEPVYMFGSDERFDVVFGNPPYVQLQRNRGELAKRYGGAGYESFDKTGDIYQLFIERSLGLLSEPGVLGLIVSNSWTRTLYGQATREILRKSAGSIKLIEAGANVFPTSTVDSCILIVDRTGAEESVGWDLSGASGFELPPSDPSTMGELVIEPPGGWYIALAGERALVDRMRRVGKPLSDWSLLIRRGIITGAKDIFVVDSQTREMLISQDPRSSELIAPVVDGGDIERYDVGWADSYLLGTHNGYDGVGPVDVEEFPAIKHHLEPHYERLERRHDQGATPYNLRNCAFYGEFASPKLVWARRGSRGKFAFSGNELYCESTSYMMTGDVTALKYLLAVLNSKLTTWYVNKTAVTTGYGVISWDKETIEGIPVPCVPQDVMSEFGDLADIMMDGSPSAGIGSSTEADNMIDQLVYELYGLTDEEIAAVERAVA